MNLPVTPWWEALKLRAEIVHGGGAIEDVQMSLYQAVYGTVNARPAYADPDHYGEITHPSPQFIDFMAQVAVRLGGGSAYTAAPALWRLDQAMGGGKSHGLIGLYHLAAHPTVLGQTDVGRQALSAASQLTGSPIAPDLGSPQVVVLACDNMTAGKAVPENDGPAVTLHERFLWRLFGGDMALYKRYQPHHADESKLIEALTAIGRPVLILVDEIMDYIRQLSDSALADLAVREMAFLKALLDAVNDVPRVAMVVVMIASEKDTMDLDAAGQARRAELDSLLVRNGKTATINDNTDFAGILRRRLFESGPPVEVLDATARVFAQQMTGAWKSKVFDVLNARWTEEWQEEVARCYPFHPQLIALAEQEWAKLAGFQRVRSTIRIFAATAYSLAARGSAGAWAPLLIGPGDIPLADTTVRESLIGSGLIGDTRTQANYRQVASTDIVAGDDHTGSARMLDRERRGALYADVNPRPAERAATCLFLCSIVGTRGGGRQGATEAELKASTFVPNANYGIADADGIVAELRDVDGGGLASLEVIAGKGGQAQRLFLSTRKTLNMLFHAARGAVTDEERDEEIWRIVQRLAATGPFKNKLFVTADSSRPPREVLATAGIDDARATRLVVLDPRQFALFNGIDQEIRAALRAVMGIGPAKLPVLWGASAVFAVAGTRGRATARGMAGASLAWNRVAEMAEVRADEELLQQARAAHAEAQRAVETAVKRAYQHLLYLSVGDDGEARSDRLISFEHENQSALDGTTVWKRLVEEGKAVEIGAFGGKALLHNLTENDYNRPLDEVRDLFWNAPRMPLLPEGDADLQRAIYEAVTGGSLRLVGADGVTRSVARPGEIGVGQTGLRLARPVDAGALGSTGTATPGSVDDDKQGATGEGTSGSTEPGTSGAGEGETPQFTEQEIAFTLMTSLTDPATRDALYHLLGTLMDQLDSGTISYGEFMVKLRIATPSSGELVEGVRAAGATPNVRAV